MVILTNKIGLKDLKEFNNIQDFQMELIPINGTRGPVINGRGRAYRDYLLNHQHEYNRVILTDSRDVMFQRNVFQNKHFPPTGHIGFTLESGMRPVGLEHYNKVWIVACYDEETRKRMENVTISCAGFVMGGDVQSTIQYVDTMLFEFDNEASKCLNHDAADQGVHNYVAYMRDTPFRKVFIDNELSPCYTLGGDFVVGINGLNQVLNQKEEVVSAVHQYDRRGPFVDMINDNFRTKVRYLTRFQQRW